MRRLRLSLLLLLAANLPTTASELIIIPPYTPQVGEAVTYRSEREITREYRGILDLGSYTVHGVFNKTMTVIARGKKTMRVRWRVSADVPTHPSPRPEYRSNGGFANVLSLWGVNRLTIETDLGGVPYSVVGTAQIGKNMAKRIAQAPDDPINRRIDKMRKSLLASPLVIVEELVPEAELLALAQFDSAIEIRIGSTEENEGDVSIADTSVKAKMIWTFAAADAETVTITWSEIVDPQILAETYGPRVERALSAVRRREGELSEERMAEVRRLSWTRTGRAIVSRKTGATLEASEVKESIALGELERTTLKVARLPGPAR